ncbi:MAG: cellulase family glycosylhydrolase [Chloroflexi bacterium AL-N10]|nr:cellulase family glycosylhydrolase [Chloroflexi bacterium AL-N1]NOK71087.1 cellulase family glycosylhydrolase [Chloroflexi bacterium AL-N10]NOK77334.1 cellulase family glycosylhydrolase [Chloroflexi bacterium AL-N5]
MQRLLMPIILIMAGVGVLWITNAQAHRSLQSNQRCFAETDVCIEGPIRTFWEQYNGLYTFGFPLAPQEEARVEGQRLHVQWFERVRLEVHPDNPPSYRVLIGRLGEERLAQQGRSWQESASNTPDNDCRFFAETGYNVCGTFLETWEHSIDPNGGASNDLTSLRIFGLPLSEARVETLEDGRTYTVQWFERTRFELHPENEPPYDVLIGRLGDEVRSYVSPTATPQPTTTPTFTPTPEPTSKPRRRKPQPTSEPTITPVPTFPLYP